MAIKRQDGQTLRIQLEPEVNATWAAELFGKRLVRLHALAMMRARCDQLARMNELGANRPPPTTTVPARPTSPPTALIT